MNEIKVMEKKLTSMEVAEMVEKEHDKLCRDIRRYIEQLDTAKIGDTDFFEESNYKDSSNRKQKCYLITRKGCEFIAHKLTGQKGTAFTARYINRFHEMESELVDDSESKALVEVKEFMKKFMESQQQFVEQQMAVNRVQTEFNKMLMEIVQESKKNQGQISIIGSANPFNLSESIIEKRMEILNELIDQVAELCGMDRNKILHFMYQRLQESEDINLKSYRNIFRTEMQNNEICTFHVVCSVDHLFEKAVKMNKDVIARKRIYG